MWSRGFSLLGVDSEEGDLDPSPKAPNKLLIQIFDLEPDRLRAALSNLPLDLFGYPRPLRGGLVSVLAPVPPSPRMSDDRGPTCLRGRSRRLSKAKTLVLSLPQDEPSENAVPFRI